MNNFKVVFEKNGREELFMKRVTAVKFAKEEGGVVFEYSFVRNKWEEF